MAHITGGEPAAPPGLSHQELAARLHEARRRRHLLTGASGGPHLTLREAYEVQEHLTALHVSSGREVAGYKLGFTSQAMRHQMGVAAPNYGPLYADMMAGSGSTARGYMQPRLEPEVAVVLATDLSGAGLPRHEVARAVADVRACLEIVDSVWLDYRFTMEQNTADGSSAAGVVLGPSLGVDPADCHRVRVSLTVDGELSGTATGAAAGGHPLAGVAWLCEQLGARGKGLHAGDVVITGGLTSAVPLAPGSLVEALYQGEMTVSVRGAR